MQATLGVIQSTLKPIVVCAPVLVLLLGLSTVLAGSKQDCENPVRLWLTGNIWLYLIFLISEFLFALNYHNRRRHGDSNSSCSGVRLGVIYSLLTIWFLWFLFGNAWVWSDFSCMETWPTGYFSAVALLCMYYLLLGVSSYLVFSFWKHSERSIVESGCYFIMESTRHDSTRSCK